MLRFRNGAILVALSAVLFVLSPLQLPAQPKKKLADPPATDPSTMKVAKGFKVELLYSVPKDEMGSWVCMCADDKGRLIVSDQYGALYRVVPRGIGKKPEQTTVTKIPAQIGNAQGLLWAFDALYVVVNAKVPDPNNPKAQRDISGLYRVSSSNRNDTLDKVELLRQFEGGGAEHGPHAILMHPDGKRLTVVCGNQTKITKLDSSRVPQVWGEDHLLPRLPDGNGFMKDVLGPGGAIYNVSPDGKQWELFSVGFRNQYDAAYNSNGELFTYDADMEWDFNTPWYRPTRVCNVTSGSEWGWRNGAGKWPVHYPDTLPPAVNVGPGSPTGVCFGYGAKFPQKYQNALFICDWSYGKLYATHIRASGSTYTAELEEFVTGTPLPLTDVIINPVDGAMYFTIGGRKTKSGMYRVTYTGPVVPREPVDTFDTATADAARKTRTDLEAYHKPGGGLVAVNAAWKELDNADRFIRFAARTALEHQDPVMWADKAMKEKDPQKAILSLLALARVGGTCPQHAKPQVHKPDAMLRASILKSLNEIDTKTLTAAQKIDHARTYQVALNRLGPPTADERTALIATLTGTFPSSDRALDGMLLEILVYLQDDTAAAKAMKLLKDAPTQEEQIEYARSLRMLLVGWTPETRRDYFAWFVKAAGYKGGNSFGKFLALIRNDAILTLTAAEKVALKALLTADPASVKLPPEPARPFVKAYKLADLTDTLDKGLKSGRDYDRGRKLFAAGKCFACHRFDNEGGSNAPDLTGVAGRFSPRDLLESIIDPSKEVSDQYAAIEIRTSDDRVVTGRIVNLSEDFVMVNTDMLNPGGTVRIDRKLIESMKPSKLSMMPTGLLDAFKEDEVLDAMAYMLSRGDRKHAMFKK